MTRGASVVSPTTHPLYQAWGNSDIPMNKKLFGLIALILYACSGLTACSDDDDAPKPDAPASIVGLWQEIGYIHWEERFGTEYDPDAWITEDDMALEFTDTGRLLFLEMSNGEWTPYMDPFEYTLTGKDLMYSLIGNTHTLRCTVEELTETTLIIGDNSSDPEEGRVIHLKKYRRIR